MSLNCLPLRHQSSFFTTFLNNCIFHLFLHLLLLVNVIPICNNINSISCPTEGILQYNIVLITTVCIVFFFSSSLHYLLQLQHYLASLAATRSIEVLESACIALKERSSG